jgi:amino acid transporter
MKRYQLGLAFGMIFVGFFLMTVGLCLTGCPTANTAAPAAPANPPQVQVLQYAQLATAAGDTAAHVLLALCVPLSPTTPAALDLGTCNQVKTVLLKAKTFVDAATAEANKVPATEPWSTARINIALAGVGVALPASVNSPELQTDLNSLGTLVNQILGVK